ncbi:GNAT family N-acetyltransferase [Maritimibacter sp. HL-12]|jgi:L-ornithine Nalpha-acyltransferase|uniref:GNAT family N-acetyltransferase n=1 Tax=Maritimibacter sp. HL-12 TaxID=1162418 RepID=UPI000A0F035D|nr:GNAT family N-acyltransferase [Maritimibacter sp. HL-12]SMH55579.1 Putative hemolysin [Maritimibacter sp. HL-12]
MAGHRPDFELRLARNEADIRAAQRLRYEVFVAELGGDGVLVDHEARLECDAFDAHYDHLLLIDKARPGAPAVGVYRLMRDDMVQQVGRYYSESEYDLSVLKASGRRLLELGRSCVHRDYRGGAALMHLWRGLLAYVERHRIDVMFGVASFHGTDPAPLAQPLSLLHHGHLAPPELRVRALPDHFQRMDLVPAAGIDRVEAMRAVPALIKAYIRLGGFVGEGAFIDAPFNTTDVCVVVDIARVPAKSRAMYARGDLA